MNQVKVVIAGHDLKFAQGLIRFFESQDNVIIKLDKWYSHDAHDEEYSETCLEWANVIFCEWGLGNAVWYSKYKKVNQKLYVRMHRQELDTFYPKNFVLENIDKIIAISPYIYEEFYRKFRFPRDKMEMIYNYVEMNKYDIEKHPESEFNLGVIGICPKMKRLDLAIDVFEELYKIDNRYRLFIKGKMPQEYNWIWNREDQKSYYENIFNRIENSEWKDNVTFDGFGSDVNEWLKKIGFVLSMSDFESFHLAVAEGMASGAYPIIRNWDGATTIYNNEWIVENIDESVNKVRNIGALYDKEIKSQLHDFVSDNFSLSKVVREYADLIN